MKHLRKAVPATLAVLLLPALAHAQDDANKALALQARGVFKQYCYRCHGLEVEVDGLLVLDHQTLIRPRDKEAAYIVAGKPAASLLFQRVDKGSMPPRKERERPGPAEKEILRKWIEAGATPFPTALQRTYVSTKEVLTLLRDHLRETDRQVRPFLRFFTLTHLHNNPRITDDDLAHHRAALAKALNSLSWKPRIVIPRAIDKHQTVFVVDIRDLDWDRDHLWRAVMREYPYGLGYGEHPDRELRKLAADVEDLSSCELAHVRADWFVTTATRPPLYHILLQLPDTDAKLEAKLGVNFAQNFQHNKLVRAGFATSGVSGQNRLLERHDAPNTAYYWKSYDFKRRQPRSSLTLFPLGPDFPGNPHADQAFIQAGGEIIFSLPNGLQGYFLVDGKGKRIDEGPPDVVSDSLKTAGTPLIVTGLSCMACHKSGMLLFKDTIRLGSAVGGDARRKVEDLYPEPEAMAKLVKEDEDRFMRAYEKTAASFLQVGANKGRPLRDFEEPIGEVARAYLLSDLKLADVAFELGLEKAEVLEGMLRGNKRARDLGMGPVLIGGTLKRDDWEAIGGTSLFQRVARELELGTPIRIP